jgi:hypothetical protein
LQAIRERCGSEVSRADCATVMSELGPRWQSLQSLYLGNDELLALIELPEEFSGDLEKYKLHPAIIDVVTGVAKQYLADGGSYLPLSYRKVTIHGPLPQKLYGHAKARVENQRRTEVMSFDVVIMDEQGRELSISKSSPRRKLRTLQPPSKASPATIRTANSVAAVTPALSNGLTPREGVEVFARILSGNVSSQIVVSATDIQALMEQAREQANISAQVETLKPLAPRSVHPRPEIDTPYVEPRDEREQMLLRSGRRSLGSTRLAFTITFSS